VGPNARTRADRVREDFEGIAKASAATHETPHYYDRLLTSFVPPHCRRLLDIGCGTGRVSRMLAHRVEHITAIDVSPQMIRLARERSAAYPNIVYAQADVLDLAESLGLFDCVISVNLLHHLNPEAAAWTMKRMVAPGGSLIVHDLRRTTGVVDSALDVPRLAVKIAWRLSRVSRTLTYFRERAAWAQHARDDVIPSAAEIRQMRDTYFAGATLRQHFLWRYTLIWSDLPTIARQRRRASDGGACPP
jgi:2-polyprenyl-3-methyl-5-hydroxy-6-metoxy-1,4-benzoquinol methylase